MSFPFPLHRSLLLALLGLFLLAGPLWIPLFHLDDPTYTYERTEVVVDAEEGITFAETDRPEPRYLSEDIACTQPFRDARICALERLVRSNETVPSGIYTTNPNLSSHSISGGRYQYVQLDGTTYEPTLVPNRSVRNDEGLTRLDLALERVPPRDALRAVAINISADADVPAVVRSAARTGSATTHRDVEVPRNPLEVEAGEYYVVTIGDRSDPVRTAVALAVLGPLIAPFFGLFLLYRAWNSLELRYVGPVE